MPGSSPSWCRARTAESPVLVLERNARAFVTYRQPQVARASRADRDVTGAPSPYLTALPTRFVTTWSRRLRSQQPTAGPEMLRARSDCRLRRRVFVARDHVARELGQIGRLALEPQVARGEPADVEQTIDSRASWLVWRSALGMRS